MEHYLNPAVAHACRLLRLIVDADRPKTASELARAVGMSRSTCFRVMKTLLAERMVESTEEGYRVGPRLMVMGLSLDPSGGLRKLAVPQLQTLTGLTRETSHFAILAESRSFILEVCDSPEPLRVASRSGTRAWLHASATGKVLWAHLPDGERDALISTFTFERQTPRTILSRSAMVTELKRIRSRGYAVDDEEYYEGVRCLAAPVFRSGAVVGAIGITGAASRVARRRLPKLSRQVRAAATGFSTILTDDTFDAKTA